jgi:hypothetical protein
MIELRFGSFADSGHYEKERVVLSATADLKVGDYAVFASKPSRSTGGATAGSKRAYWFPDKEIKQGDSVVIYTKKGKTSTKILPDDRTAHFFYWGLDEPLWAAEMGIVVVKVETWQFRKAPFAPADD